MMGYRTFTLTWVLEESWEFAHPVYLCYVKLEKAFDYIPRGTLWWGVGGVSVIMGPLFSSIQSLYKQCNVSWA